MMQQSENPPKYVIPRGDDFGSFPEATAAMVDAVRNGWLRNLGFMAASPDFSEAVELSRGLKNCDFGLHVVLSSEWERKAFRPVHSHPRFPLDSDGRFLPSPNDLHDVGVHLDAVMEEVEAQYEHAIRSGLHLSYLDEHMGCGWIYDTSSPDRRLIDYLLEFCDTKKLVFHSRCQQKPGLKLEAFDSEETLRRHLEEGSPHMLFMTHPAYAEGEILADRLRNIPDQFGDTARARSRDHEILINHRFREIIEEAGYGIVRYSEAVPIYPVALPAPAGAVQIDQSLR